MCTRTRSRPVSQRVAGGSVRARSRGYRIGSMISSYPQRSSYPQFRRHAPAPPLRDRIVVPMTRFLATPRPARRLLIPLLPAVLVAFLAVLCALGGTPASAAPASPPLDDPPTFVWPLAPPHPIVRPFEPPSGPYEPGHRGVDLGGAPDEPVY